MNNLPNKTTVFSYNGSAVSFRKEGDLYINATEMAKPFGESKIPIFWLRTQQSKEFMEALSEVRNLDIDALTKVENGGATPGTWMLEDVALEFARWLSPEFAIWCNDRVKELLINGVAYRNASMDNLPEIVDLQGQLYAEQQAHIRSVKKLEKELTEERQKTREALDAYYKERGLNLEDENKRRLFYQNRFSFRVKYEKLMMIRNAFLEVDNVMNEIRGVLYDDTIDRIPDEVGIARDEYLKKDSDK